MFGWLKSRRANKHAYRRGQEAATAITDLIEAYIGDAVIPAGNRFVEVFHERIGTIFNNPDDPPRQAALTEWKIFEENLQGFIGRVRDGIDAKMLEWNKAIELTGAREDMDRYIRQRLSTIQQDMRLKAAGMMPGVLAEIESREANGDAV